MSLDFHIKADGGDFVAEAKQIRLEAEQFLQQHYGLPIPTPRCEFCALVIGDTGGDRYKDRPRKFCSARCRGWAHAVRNGIAGAAALHIAKMADEIRSRTLS